MCPRYNKKGRKYKIKTPKAKMSFEKKTAIRSVSSIAIFVLLFVFSFFSFAKPVGTYLDTSYTKERWKGVFESVIKKGRTITDKYTFLTDSLKNRLGIEEPKAEPALAKEKKAPKKGYEPQEENKDTPPKVKWQLPTEGEITDPYGERIHPVTGETSFHTGVDIAAAMGQDVVSAYEGTISSVGCDELNGKYIVVEHEEDIKTTYSHLSEVCAKIGDAVSPTTIIGKAGDSGLTTGPHLHFEIKVNGKSTDPVEFISKER